MMRIFVLISVCMLKDCVSCQAAFVASRYTKDVNHIDRQFIPGPLEAGGINGEIRGVSQKETLIECSAVCLLTAKNASGLSNNGTFCTSFSFCKATAICNLLLGVDEVEQVVGSLETKEGCSVYMLLDRTETGSSTTTDQPVTISSSTAAAMTPTSSTNSTTHSSTSITAAASTTVQTTPITTTPSFTEGAPASKQTYSAGYIFIPIMLLTNYSNAGLLCRKFEGRVIDITTNIIKDEVCNVLANMISTSSETFWIHGTGTTCGNDGQKWQLHIQRTVPASTCTLVENQNANSANAIPLCFTRTLDSLSFVLTNTTAFKMNLRVHLEFTRNYSSADQWCRSLWNSQDSRPYQMMKYGEDPWLPLLKSYLATNKKDFPCGMDFWLAGPAGSLNCTAAGEAKMLPFLRLENDGSGNLNRNEISLDPCNSSVEKFALCADA